MKKENQVIALCDAYKKELLLAIEEKTGSLVVDPMLDLLILSLIDKVETLDWVLGKNLDEGETTTYISDYGNSVAH